MVLDVFAPRWFSTSLVCVCIELCNLQVWAPRQFTRFNWDAALKPTRTEKLKSMQEAESGMLPNHRPWPLPRNSRMAEESYARRKWEALSHSSLRVTRVDPGLEGLEENLQMCLYKDTDHCDVTTRIARPDWEPVVRLGSVVRRRSMMKHAIMRSY